MRRILVVVVIFLLTVSIVFMILIGAVLSVFNGSKTESDLLPLYNKVQNLSFYEFMARVTVNPKFIEKYFIFEAGRVPSKQSTAMPPDIASGEGIWAPFNVDMLSVVGKISSIDTKRRIIVVQVGDKSYDLTYENFSLEYQLPNVRPGDAVPDFAAIRPTTLFVERLAMGKRMQFRVYRRGERFIILYVYINI